jgi:Carboxypeptidase regulatory-like domain
MSDRKLFLIVIFACSCLVTACAGDSSLVAPSSTFESSTGEMSTITGRVTERQTLNGIQGAKVTVQAGRLNSPTMVTDASGFYSIPVKSGQVVVSVKADRYIDRSESVFVANSATHVDFQLMPLNDDDDD